jgi:DNA-binding NtrC family response regulator
MTLSQPNPSATRILVIDDEVDMLANYMRLLERAGHRCATLEGPGDLEAMLHEFKPDLVLTDMVMPQGSGMEVLDRVHHFDPRLPIIILTAHGSIEQAVEAMKRNAFDYLTKPFSAEELLRKIQVLVSKRLIETSPLSEKEPTSKADQAWRQDIIGVSAAIERALELACKVARTDVNVLILGESGTGKEVFARAIHRLSRRSGEMFLPLDCASLPENLLESELFGYQKGAFTGATSSKIGLIEFAQGGTLFLDEIGEIPLPLQVKLLRVLQERQFRPIGGRQQIDMDVRLLAATNVDLEQAVLDKRFRSDLYYRLNVVTLRLPALREHKEDIPLLADHFLSRFAQDNKMGQMCLSAETLQVLKNYAWPGNVRELRNVIEFAATMTNGSVLTPAELPDALQDPALYEGDHGEASEQYFPQKSELMLHFEYDYLVALLVKHHFNISQAATDAGCHRRTLYRMIKRHQIDLDTLRRQSKANGAMARSDA